MKSITVTTAVELTASQREKLATSLKKKFGQIEWTYKVNPQLIGGIKIRVGSLEYDRSLRSRLEAVLHQLIQQG